RRTTVPKLRAPELPTPLHHVDVRVGGGDEHPRVSDQIVLGGASGVHQVRRPSEEVLSQYRVMIGASRGCAIWNRDPVDLQLRSRHQKNLLVSQADAPAAAS